MTSARLERVAGDAAPALARATRLGFGAKGLLTIIVGVLALRHALGRGGELTGPEGAIRSLRGQPLGRVTMVALAAGLAAYALWMFVAAFGDPERKGRRFAGIAERVAFFVTGIGYALLAWAGFGLFLGNAKRVGHGSRGARGFRAHAGRGRWLVGLVGATVMVSGSFRCGSASRRDSGEPAAGPVEARARGHDRQRQDRVPGARRVVAAGGLLVRAGGLEYDPSEAGGLGEALGMLSTFGQGDWALGAAAAGLILYGVYFVLLVKAKAL